MCERSYHGAVVGDKVRMKDTLCVTGYTGPNGAVAKSSANELVGTGFAFRYRLIPGFLKAQWVGVRTLNPILSH